MARVGASIDPAWLCASGTGRVLDARAYSEPPAAKM
jgi:hypothetical protein